MKDTFGQASSELDFPSQSMPRSSCQLDCRIMNLSSYGIAPWRSL
jgi:hypothetical protein